jgi:hypothetical protein
MARRTRYEGAILLSALGARMRLRTASGDTEIAVEHMWSTPLPRAALLTAIVIPLRQGLVLDYARDLRPIMTQAVVLEDDERGRVVSATEYLIPRVYTLERGNAALVEGEIELNDPVTGGAYLKRVSATLLDRQLIRMGAR